MMPARTHPAQIPKDESEIEVSPGGKPLRLTNLQKLFWPELSITKRDLLQYYAGIARARRAKGNIARRADPGAALSNAPVNTSPSRPSFWLKCSMITYRAAAFTMAQNSFVGVPIRRQSNA
jgi:hypothetical protein